MCLLIPAKESITDQSARSTKVQLEPMSILLGPGVTYRSRNNSKSAASPKPTEQSQAHKLGTHRTACRPLSGSEHGLSRWFNGSEPLPGSWVYLNLLCSSTHLAVIGSSFHHLHSSGREGLGEPGAFQGLAEASLYGLLPVFVELSFKMECSTS